MKLFIASLMMVSAGFAQADESVRVLKLSKLNCQVPVEQGNPTVTVDVTLANDTSVDFVTIAIKGPKVSETFFIQLEQGSFENQLSTGNIGTLAIQEGFAQEDGVLKKAGFLVLNKDASGNFGGMLAGLNSIFPLTCGPAK